MGLRNPAAGAGEAACGRDPMHRLSRRSRPGEVAPVPRSPEPQPALLRPYPRHDAQDGVWLPHQGVRVEGAPGFARSVRTPFHRGCTARRPPLGAHRRPVRVRGAPAPSLRATGVDRGSRQRAFAPGRRSSGKSALRERLQPWGVSVPGALLAFGTTSANWRGVEVWTESADASPPSGALQDVALLETLFVIDLFVYLPLSCRCLPQIEGAPV